MFGQNRNIGLLSSFLAICLAPAAAQSVAYLGPDTYTAQIGQRVNLHLDNGPALAVRHADWPTDKIRWFMVRAGGTQENRDKVQPEQAQDNFVTVPLEHAGVTLIGLDLKPAVETLPAAEFRTFLAARVASQSLPADALKELARGTVRVQRTESAKTLIRVQADGKPQRKSAIAQSKTGQAVEIRPMADPTLVEVGSDLPLRAYVDGGKKVGVKMLATSVAAGTTQEAVTDSSGAVHFRITQPGVWRIEFHDAAQADNDPQADWVLSSATLTFEVAEEGANK